MTASESPLREEGISLTVEFLLDQRLDRFIETASLSESLAKLLTEENTARFLDRHVRPAWRRFLDRARKRKTTIGAYISQSKREEVLRFASESGLPHATWAKGAIDADLIRQLLAPLLQDVLLKFAQRIPGSGKGFSVPDGFLGSVAQRFKPMVEKSTERIVDAGKTVFSNLGLDIEQQLQNLARDFSVSAMADIRESFDVRIKSPEGRQIIARMQRELAERLLKTPLSDLIDQTVAEPAAGFFQLLPALIENCQHHKEIKKAIAEDIEAVARVEAGRTLRELLAEAGLFKDVKSALFRHTDSLAQDFFRSEPFEAWLKKVLDS